METGKLESKIGLVKGKGHIRLWSCRGTSFGLPDFLGLPTLGFLYENFQYFSTRNFCFGKMVL